MFALWSMWGRDRGPHRCGTAACEAVRGTGAPPPPRAPNAAAPAPTRNQIRHRTLGRPGVSRKGTHLLEHGPLCRVVNRLICAEPRQRRVRRSEGRYCGTIAPKAGAFSPLGRCAAPERALHVEQVSAGGRADAGRPHTLPGGTEESLARSSSWAYATPTWRPRKGGKWRPKRRPPASAGATWTIRRRRWLRRLQVLILTRSAPGPGRSPLRPERHCTFEAAPWTAGPRRRHGRRSRVRDSRLGWGAGALSLNGAVRAASRRRAGGSRRGRVLHRPAASGTGTPNRGSPVVSTPSLPAADRLSVQRQVGESVDNHSRRLRNLYGGSQSRCAPIPCANGDMTVLLMRPDVLQVRRIHGCGQAALAGHCGNVPARRAAGRPASAAHRCVQDCGALCSPTVSPGRR